MASIEQSRGASADESDELQDDISLGRNNTVGLVNVGENCYLNSVVQVISKSD